MTWSYVRIAQIIYNILSKLLETCAFVFNNVATVYQQYMYVSVVFIIGLILTKEFNFIEISYSKLVFTFS